MSWYNKAYFDLSVFNVIKYFTTLSVAYHDAVAIFGFLIILVMVSQLISGTMLSFSLIPDPMLIPLVRDEEDLEDLYAEDFFWLHERGVDLLFVFCWFHLLRKLYNHTIDYEHDNTWKSGVFTFLILHVVTFFGLVLCCTHLSEITLLIAVNIMNTFFLNMGKFYWWLFTDKNLNSDTVIRLAYGHYVSAFFLFYLGVLHSFDMHYDWKNEVSFDGIDAELAWWDEALSSELTWTIIILSIFSIVCWILYPDPEALSYELFMWGDVGLINDIRFYGVAPHWYFRPYMAWLIACPYHNTGIFGLIFFLWLLFLQPILHGSNHQLLFLKKSLIFFRFKLKHKHFYKNTTTSIQVNLFYQITYGLFLMACLYASSFLPYGRFFNRLGGNIGMLLSFIYIFSYLTFSLLRRSNLLDLLIYWLYTVSNYLISKKLSMFFKKLDKNFLSA